MDWMKPRLEQLFIPQCPKVLLLLIVTLVSSSPAWSACVLSSQEAETVRRFVADRERDLAKSRRSELLGEDEDRRECTLGTLASGEPGLVIRFEIAYTPFRAVTFLAVFSRLPFAPIAWDVVGGSVERNVRPRHLREGSIEADTDYWGEDDRPCCPSIPSLSSFTVC